MADEEMPSGGGSDRKGMSETMIADQAKELGRDPGVRLRNGIDRWNTHLRTVPGDTAQ